MFQKPMEKFKAHACTLPGVMAVEATSNRSLSRHTHDQFGIGLVLHGAQDSTSGRGQMRAVKGDLITVNVNKPHDGRAIDDQPRSWCMLYFEPELVAAVAKDMGHSAGSEWHHPVLKHAQAVRAFTRLYTVLTDVHAVAGRDVAEQELFEILAPLLGNEQRVSVGPVHPLSKEIMQAKARIDAQPQEPVSLAELAADAGWSRFHFLRSFKAATQLPPHAYQLQRQMQLARRLILAGYSVAHAAVMAGFVDQSHLTRRFVACYGFTPGAIANLRKSTS
ncbi:MAG: AraC family transcriptional regulator [Acidovorax sp.]|uniref:helix-turn-helix transcriptional regulator n=1 Tax=Acidovorax sp. TaxID=1872122 RepID=UPI0039E5B1BA